MDEMHPFERQVAAEVAREMRPSRPVDAVAVIAAAEASELPFAHRGLDPRWSDVRSLVRALAAESSIRLVACPVWSQLLGLDGRLDHLECLDEAQLIDLLQRAETIVGGY